MSKLNVRQKAFVEEYIIDFNATQAAIRAGYSEKTAQEQSSRLLSNVIVKAAVDEAKLKRSERTQVTSDWVLQEAKSMYHEAREAGEYGHANKALELCGKHTQVQAFTEKQVVEVVDKTEMLIRARTRAEESRNTTH
jgi:phage terminase small subunit